MKESQYLTLKKKTDHKLKSIKNCCTLGCSSCCYQLIELFNFEKTPIKNSVSKLDEETKFKVRENLESWFIFFNENTPVKKELDEFDTIHNLMNIASHKKHKCPLLIDNKCSIYNHRPLSCRIHLVDSNPEVCEKEPYRTSTHESIKIRSEIMREMKSIGKYQILYLPYILLETIPINVDIKPLKKLMVEK